MGRVLHLLEEAVAEAVSLARTVATSAKDANVWDDSFRTDVQELLARTGTAIGAGDEHGPRARCATSSAGWSVPSPPTPSRGRTGTSTAVWW